MFKKSMGLSIKDLRSPLKRTSFKSIFTTVLFLLICLTFVFVGVTPDQGGVSGAGVAATVNDTVISIVEFQKKVTALEGQMGMNDKNLPAAQRQMIAQQMRHTALEQLVNFELIYQVASREGVLPTKSATREMILAAPAFQEDGRFARDRYNQYLKYENTSAEEFENKLQKNVVVKQLQDIFMSALKTPQVIAGIESKARNTKLNLEFIEIKRDANVSAPSEAEVAQYLAVEANKTKVNAYFTAHKEEFSTPPEVWARHILIKGSDDKALSKAKDIAKEAQSGANFEELAKKHSEDEGSKQNGGDLKFFGKGQMVKEFEDVAFSLAPGKISEPVKSPFGFHVIKVEEKRGGEVAKLETHQNAIAKKLITDERLEAKLKEVSELLESKKDITSWASQNKLKWQETGEFSIDQNFIPKMMAGDEALNAALKLKTAGEVYSKLVRNGDTSFIIKLKKLSEGAAEFSEQQPFAGAGYEALGLWAEELKKSARIDKNYRLIN